MQCPCHSNQRYSDCCQPLHARRALPITPVALMRSRYSAYALDLPDYLIWTTHPEGPTWQPDRKSWQRSLRAFSRTTEFKNLIIEKSTPTTVTFHAILTSHGEDISFRETSLFAPHDDHLCYVGPLSI